MATNANIFTRLFSFLGFGQVKVGGTITTLSDNDAYATHISNLGVGGHHSYETIQDLADIPTARLQVGMSATIGQHTSPQGKLLKRTTYTLEKELPTGIDKLSDLPNYDVSQYWKVESIADDYSGAFETQYAPNIDKLSGAVDPNGGQPPFPGKAGNGIKVTQAEYNILPYWESTYNPTKGHVWQRQRFADSPDSPWGIPVKIAGESYEQGDYIANIFKRQLTIPETPPQFLNGAPNNNPLTWNDIPPVGNEALWFSKAQKDVYGQLKSPWTTPIQIQYNPLLVRYNEVATPNPNDIPYSELTQAGWLIDFDSSIHKYMATRQESTTGVYGLWTIIKIAQESGEYIDYIYKAFKLEDVEEVLDNPDLYRPVGNSPADWNDAPFKVAEDERLLVSSARKFFNGELITKWSDPVPFSGDDTILDVITSSGGDEFKWNKNVTPNQVIPDKITLTARLFRGTTQVTPSTIEWRKLFNNGVLDADPNVLSSTDSLVILPEDVKGKAIFECTQVFQGVSYESEYSILDISDGIDAKSLVLTANSQIITRRTNGSRSPSAITLRAYSSNLSDEGQFTWFKKIGTQAETQIQQNGSPYQSNSLAVEYADFQTTDEITYRVASEDGIDDTFTVYQVAEASNGSPAILLVLTNDSHNLVQDEATGIVDFSGAFTRVRILEGATNVTDLWTIKKTDSPSITSATTYKQGTTDEIAVDSALGSTVPIQITRIGATDTTGFVTITATRGNTTLTKQFSISKIVDPAGAVILDIDSNQDGFVFSPTTADSKELVARLSIDGVDYVRSDNKFTSLRWIVDGVLQPVNATDYLVITKDQVEFQVTVKATVLYKGINYSRTINITDVKDAKGLGILYTKQEVDAFNKPISADDRPFAAVPYDTKTGVTVGAVEWTLDATDSVYLSIRKESDTEWGIPIRIRGEKGDQGIQGNFIKNIFRWNSTVPQTPTGNPIPSGWFDTPPALVQGSALWMSIGEVTTPKVGEQSQIVGEWSTPVQISGTRGSEGNAATIEIGSVTTGSPLQIRNSGTSTNAIFDFVIPSGGSNTGISKVYYQAGGNLTTSNPVGNYAQGTVINLNPSTEVRRLVIRGWVSIQMNNYAIDLQLTSGNVTSYNAQNLIKRRRYHVQERGFVTQHVIDAVIDTADQFIGFSFSDAISEGQFYYDYALEVTIIY